MKRTTLALAALLICGSTLISCTTISKEGDTSTPPDLTGSWIQSNSDSGQKMSAEISSDTIEVYWSANESRAPYWAGTYVAPTESGTYTWSSVNDHDKTDMALLASGDDTKDFTYNKNGEITFDVTALGVTKTVHIVKAD